jgi:hypothetical protein
LLSAIILCLSGSSTFQKKIVEPILKNLLIHPPSFLVLIMDRNAFYFTALE